MTQNAAFAQTSTLLLLSFSILWWRWYNLAGAALCDKRKPRLPNIVIGEQQRLTSVSDNFIVISESRQKALMKRMDPGYVFNPGCRRKYS